MTVFVRELLWRRMKPTWALLSQEGDLWARCRSSPQNGQASRGARTLRSPCSSLSGAVCSLDCFSLHIWFCLFPLGRLALAVLASTRPPSPPTLYHLQFTWTKSDLELRRHTLEKKKKKDSWLFACTQIHSKCIALGVASADVWVSCDSCFVAPFNRSLWTVSLCSQGRLGRL